MPLIIPETLEKPTFMKQDDGLDEEMKEHGAACYQRCYVIANGDSGKYLIGTNKASTCLVAFIRNEHGDYCAIHIDRLVAKSMDWTALLNTLGGSNFEMTFWGTKAHSRLVEDIAVAHLEQTLTDAHRVTLKGTYLIDKLDTIPGIAVNCKTGEYILTPLPELAENELVMRAALLLDSNEFDSKEYKTHYADRRQPHLEKDFRVDTVNRASPAFSDAFIRDVRVHRGTADKGISAMFRPKGEERRDVLQDIATPAFAAVLKIDDAVETVFTAHNP